MWGRIWKGVAQIWTSQKKEGNTEKVRDGSGGLRRNNRAQPITGTCRKEWISYAEEVCGIWKVREGSSRQSQGHTSTPV